MRRKCCKNRFCAEAAPCAITVPAITLLETVIALAIMGIVFAAVLPQFRVINNSWDSKQGNAEVLQNGRVLIDHINRNLSKAVKITAVSGPAETDGYIEFEDNDGNNLRYDITANNYIEFGSVGDLSDLAGPVSSLLFTCYDSNDFVNPTTDVNTIRLVDVQAILPNPSALSRDKTFTTSVYLRTNWNSSSSGLVGWWKLDETTGTTAADSSGNGNDGTLINMGSSKWTTGAVGGALRFDGNNDYVSLPIGSIINSLTNCTIAEWVNWDGGSSWQRIWDFGSSESVNMFLTVNNGDTGTPRFAITISGWTDEDQVTAPDVLTGGWHHIAVTIDADNSVHSLYIDGELVDENTSLRYTPSDLGSTTRNRLGRSQYSADPYFDGTLDDVRIYDRALSDEEITQLAVILVYRDFEWAKAATDVTNLTISTPDSNEGDLLIAAVATDGDTSATIEPPSGEGWNEIDIGSYNGEVTLGVWWKLADASESASHQFSWSESVAEQAYGWIMRFTGHDPDDPIDDYSVDGETSSTPTSPEVITTVSDCLIVRLGAFDDDDITVDDTGLTDHFTITMDESASSGGGISYGGLGEGKQTSSSWWATYVDVYVPSGTSEGDLLIAAVVTDGDTDDVPSPLSPPGGQGWEEISLEDYSDEVTLGVWWKLAGASEPTSHQFTWSGGRQAYGWIMRFTGHNPSAPINASATYGNRSRSPDCPSVTTTVANTMIVRIGGFDDDDVSSSGHTGLDEHTDITMDESSTHGDTCSGGAGYIMQAAIGPSGEEDFSLTGNPSGEEYRTVTIAIAPAIGGGTVSGGAGYIRQSSSGDSGTSDFSLTLSNEAQMITIAIAPADSDSTVSSGGIRP